MKNKGNTYSPYSCLNLSIMELMKNYSIDGRWLVTNNFSITYGMNLGIDQINKKLRQRQAIHFTKFCEKVYGMRFRSLDISEELWSDKANVISEKRNLLIGFDAYYAPWNPAYDKTHIFHFMIVKDIDKNGNLVCIDTYMSKECITWKRELVEQAVKICYMVLPPKKMPDISSRNIVNMMGCNLNAESIRKNYELFIQDLQQVSYYEQLFETTEVSVCELILVTKRIAEDSKRLVEFFQRLDMENNDIVGLFEQLHELWEKVTFIFMKMFISKKINPAKINMIIDSVVEIMKMEIRIASRLKKIKIK